MVKTEVEIVVNTTDATKSIDKVGDSVDNVADKFENLTAGAEGAKTVLDEATGGLATRVTNVAKGVRAMGRSFIKAFRAAITGASGMRKALIATGIGAIVAAVGTLIAYWEDIAAWFGYSTERAEDLTEETGRLTEAQEEYNKALAGAQGAADANAISLGIYLKAVNDVTAAEEDRLAALNKLKDAGIITEDIDLANAESLGLLNERVEQNIKLTYARAQANAAAQYLEKEMIRLYELQAEQAEERAIAFELADKMQDDVIVGGMAEYVLQGSIKKQNQELLQQEANILRAKESYKEALEELIPIEGESLEMQEDTRKELERRAKTDSAVAQALKDREAAEEKAASTYAQTLQQLELLKAEDGEKDIVRIKQNYEERIALFTEVYGAESEELKNLMILRDAEIQAVEDAQQKTKEEKDKQNREARAALLAEIATAEANTQAEIHAKELEDTAKHYDQLIAQAKEAGIDITELEKSKAEKLKEIQDQADQQAN